MLTVNKNEIHLTRGDTAFIKPIPEIESEYNSGVFEVYTFEDGDRVVFRLGINSSTVLEKECDIDLDENKAILTINPEDTENLEVRTYYYCFELITATGNHFTFVENAKFTLGKELEKRG